ncbi:MAG: type II toxin-antitoxin system VapC family toxin [Propionibacteriaceae bacterium]|nr:type II toxin-antitoxin system VapC family toxin [Propionibacteriaceae bacterium]
MIGIDTNVLLRYLTNDDAAQSPRARTLLAGRTTDDPAFISIVTLVEVVWTLSTPRYGYAPAAILDVVAALASVETVCLQDSDAVLNALATSRLTGCDFPDALTAEFGSQVGCDHTATFDTRAIAAIPAMRALETSQQISRPGPALEYLELLKAGVSRDLDDPDIVRQAQR